MRPRTAFLLSVALTMGPGVALAAGGEGQGAVARVLFALGVLLLAANLGGLAAERLGQPPVLGELVIGIALTSLVVLLRGADAVAYVQSEPTLQILAEVGVLILLFDVGLQTDIRSLVRVGPSALLVALIGIAAPLALGWGVAAWLRPDSPLAAHIFVGAALSATSVGITARVLKDLGKTQSPEGRMLLGAAILYDVLGLIVLVLVSGLATAAAGGRSSSPSSPSRASSAAPSSSSVVEARSLPLKADCPARRSRGPSGDDARGRPVPPLHARLRGRAHRPRRDHRSVRGRAHPGPVRRRRTRPRGGPSPLRAPASDLDPDRSAVLRPRWGSRWTWEAWRAGPVFALAAALTVCALAGKLVGPLGVVDRSVSRLAVGIGMLPRGEVGLIFAGIGTTLVIGGRPVFDQNLFSAVVLMVLVTTIVAPAGLRWALRHPARRARCCGAVQGDDPA